MSIKLVVTRGYSNGTVVGTIDDVVTRGYTVGAAIVLNPLAFGVSTTDISKAQGVSTSDISKAQGVSF